MKVLFVLLVLILLAILVAACAPDNTQCSYTLTCCGINGCTTKWATWKYDRCPACPLGLTRQSCYTDCYDVE